jgi:N-acetylglucosamine kinase-like BadF-type ATPase
MLQDEAGRAAVTSHLAAALSAARTAAPDAPLPARVVTGVTGLDAAPAPGTAAAPDPQHAALQAAFAHAWAQAMPDAPAAALHACSDIELLCRTAFAPGAGLVLYAGTGSVAAMVDGDGHLQRAGGRGVLLDDAGGGHWIACMALRHVWRAEDEAPGAWQQSALAQRLFARLGGADWSFTRRGVYGADRGAVGRLALAVAEAAQDGDAAALAILGDAGDELARLVHALWRRHGRVPVALAGRALQLHPVVGQRLAAALPPGTPLTPLAASPEVLAAGWAVRGTPLAHTPAPAPDHPTPPAR